MLVKVTEVEHYTERLFRFKTERPATFKFSAGEFTMVGIENLELKVLLLILFFVIVSFNTMYPKVSKFNVSV